MMEEKAMANGKLEVYRSLTLVRSQRWRWRLIANNGNIIATSGEGYTDRDHAEWMALRVVGGTYADAKWSTEE
jgi:uncharacterized protein YegP (UPF0339 family)